MNKEKYTREELIKIFETIPEPEIYEIGLENLKTKLIKKIQKKYNLNFNEICRLYKIPYTNLFKITEILT